MADDDNKPEDEDDDHLFDMAPQGEQDEEDADDAKAGDPLGDALAHPEPPGIDDDITGESDDSDLFEPDPLEEGAREREMGGHQPVLPDLPDPPGPHDEAEPGEAAGDEEMADESDGAARQRYPWLQSSGEDEDELDAEHALPSRTLIIVGAAVVALIFAALIWFLYVQGDEAPGEDEVALVTAPEGPAKVEPDDRGGLEVPDQDKLVFDRVTGEESQLEDNLLAGPEEPMTVPETDSTRESEVAPELATVEDMIEAFAGNTPAPEPRAAAGPAPDAGMSPQVSDLKLAPAPEPALTPVAPPPPAAVSTGDYLVQVGAYGSRESAETGWQTLKRQHSMLLAGLSDDVQRADLGSRGILYRLRTGPFASRSEASDFCADLKAAGQDCLVVRR